MTDQKNQEGLKDPNYAIDFSMQVDMPAMPDPAIADLKPVVVIPPPPGQVNANRRYGDRLCLPGFGPTPCDLMFVATSAFEEETEEVRKSGYFGRVEKQVPRLFRGPSAMTLESIVSSVGIGRKEFFYTALCRWLLPKNERSRPKNPDIKWGTPALMADIEKVKPKIIVTFGKPAFDVLSGLKLSAADIEGGWFSCQHDPTIALYPMFDLFRLITQPASAEQFRVDFMEVVKGLREKQGVVIPRVELHYEVVTNSQELRAWVERMRMKFFIFAVDCEWHGSNHVDGQLRSIQFAWQPGCTVYVRFRNEKNEFCFDVSYEEAGKIMNSWLDNPAVYYTGHHIAADFPWMHHVLKMRVEGRCVLDTEFALQCINEHDALGLERVGMKFTDLGRYDIDLVMWKKEKGKAATEDGYGFIPDSIIIPYAQKDVDVGIRAYPKVLKLLQVHNVYTYYKDMFNPFVTDVFTRFTIDGLPMNRNKMGKMRELFHFVYKRYELEFRSRLFEEAVLKLKNKMEEVIGEGGADQCIALMREYFMDRKASEAQSMLVDMVGAEKILSMADWFNHARDAADFKIRSSEQMRRWLFTIKGYTPIKSTANKAKGTPSVDWAKVMSYQEKARADFTPSTDKQSLQILCDTNSDPILTMLLELNAVGNLCRAFLGEADVDDNGDVIKEKGLHLYVASDDRVHGQYSTTETGRPRSWKPNALNWPSYVNKKIENCMANVLGALAEKNQLPPQFKEYITPKDDGSWAVSIPPIRSCVEAPEGWVIVESDYKTAELRGNAFIAGDENMIAIMTEPDEQFAYWIGDPENKTLVRLKYDDNSGVTKRDTSYLYSYQDPKDKKRKFVGPSGLKRDAQGNLLHPSADLHWSLAEMVHGSPRESLDEKKDRGAAKVGNFCIAKGELVLTYKGWKPIEDVLCCDLLWDGVEWVNHEGVIYSGKKEVVEYQGLKATELHDVWTRGCSDKIKHGQAVAQRLELVRSEETCPGYKDFELADFPRYSAEDRQRLLFRFDALRSMRCREMEGSEEYGERILQKVQMSEPDEDHLRSARCFKGSARNSGGALSSHGAALRKRHTRLVSAVSRKRYKGRIHLQKRILSVGSSDLARRIFQKERFRSERQRRELLEIKFAARGQNHKPSEQTLYAFGAHRARACVSRKSASRALHRSDDFEAYAPRYVRPANTGSAQHESESRKTKEDVYDIINAGPRNRFTCQGVLVSNSSAYGATPNTLERKIESDTGIKPEEGTGQRILDALRKRQPVACEYLDTVEQYPRNPGYMVAQSGRVRHFVLPKQEYGVSSRIFDSSASSQGREARNFPMQESVAATAIRAAVGLLKFSRQWNLSGFTVAVLYDSVVTCCPEEEKHIWKKAHHFFMYVNNRWMYHGRILAYPIDTEFNAAWSAKPTAEKKKWLYSPTTEAAKLKFSDVEAWLDAEIEKAEKIIKDNELDWKGKRAK